jgi:hypothetical protein
VATNRSRPIEERSWYAPVNGIASLVMAVGFGWAVLHGWEDDLSLGGDHGDVKAEPRLHASSDRAPMSFPRRAGLYA